MSEPSRKQILSDISETARFTTAHATGSGDLTDKIGSTIPFGMTRNIWSIVASSVDGSDQNFQIWKGDAASGYETTLVAYQQVNDQANGGDLVKMGGDPESPIYTIGPISTLTIEDILIALHETSAINIEIRYYDTPIDVVA